MNGVMSSATGGGLCSAAKQDGGDKEACLLWQPNQKIENRITTSAFGTSAGGGQHRSKAFAFCRKAAYFNDG